MMPGKEVQFALRLWS